MRLILFVLIILIVNPVFGQRRNRDDEEVIPTYTEGITYSLPRTGLKIYVKAIKEEFQPGPYAAYAEQLLGITDAKNRASVNWDIEDVKVTTFSEPDPNQVYKAMGEAAFLVSLTPEGCLAGINTSAEANAILNVVSNGFVKSPEFHDDFSFANINDSPLYTPGDSTNNFRPIRIGTDVKAAEAAKRILEARRFMYDMAAGMMDEFHPDGKAYEVSLKELKEIEKDYMSLFVGRTIHESKTYSFDFVPSPSVSAGEVVFRFSDENGVVSASDLSGKPVMLKVQPVEGFKQKYSATASSQNPAAGESGIFYRLPAVAEIELIYELETIATLRTTIVQYGDVAPFPEDLLTGEFEIHIHPETGAVKSITRKYQIREVAE